MVQSCLVCSDKIGAAVCVVISRLEFRLMANGRKHMTAAGDKVSFSNWAFVVYRY